MRISPAAFACFAVLASGHPVASGATPRDASEPVDDPVAQLCSDAERGDVKAEYVLGCLYNGDRGHAQEPAKAAAWWGKAALGGNSDAQFCYGLSCYLGQGVTKDQAEAVKWWKKASDQDNADAQYFLALSCLKGTGTVRSREQAVYWLRRSADLGNQEAASQLATIGLVGRNSPSGGVTAAGAPR